MEARAGKQQGKPHPEGWGQLTTSPSLGCSGSGGRRPGLRLEESELTLSLFQRRKRVCLQPQRLANSPGGCQACLGKLTDPGDGAQPTGRGAAFDNPFGLPTGGCLLGDDDGLKSFCVSEGKPQAQEMTKGSRLPPAALKLQKGVRTHLHQLLGSHQETLKTRLGKVGRVNK